MRFNQPLYLPLRKTDCVLKQLLIGIVNKLDHAN